MANHIGLIRFICTAKAWNNAVRSKSSALRGAPCSALHEFGNVLDVRCRHGAAGVVDQDVDAAVVGHHRVDERVDSAVVALVADQLGERCRPLRVVGLHAGHARPAAIASTR